MSHNPFKSENPKKDTVKILISGTDLVDFDAVYLWHQRPVAELQSAIFRLEHGLPYVSLRDSWEIPLNDIERQWAITRLKKELKNLT